MKGISYNIHKGIGGRDQRYRLDRIIRVLAEESADLVCLQEVDTRVHRTKFDDQPSLIAEALEIDSSLYQLNLPRGEGGYGNLILTRWPIREAEQFSIRRGRRKNRGAQLAVLESPQGPLLVVHWHLGLNERERAWQVRKVLANGWFQARSDLPILILGDSNDWRNVLERRPFGPEGFIHATSPAGRFRSFPAYLPMASLDKVWSRGSITIDTVRLVKTKLARRASDHLPLVVDFTLAD